MGKKHFEFPFKKEGDALGAGHVNDLGEGVRRAMGDGTGPSKKFHLRVYEITKKYAASEVNGTTVITQYLARPRYWDVVTNAWALDSTANEAWLDASEFDSFLVGDKVPAYFDDNRGTLIPLSGASDVGSGGSGSGNGGCCCNEGACLPKIPGVDPYYPLFYSIYPNHFICGCTGGQGEIRLYPDPPDQVVIWKSDPSLISCLGSVGILVPCTNVATWRWGRPTCNGVCAYVSNEIFPGPTYEWAIDPSGSNCSSGCGCLDPNDVNFLGGTPTATGQTYSQACVNPSAEFTWVRISVSDDQCSCTPDAPDFPGTVEGQEATTSCTGTKSAGGGSDLFPAYWQLTIGPMVGDCDTSKLEFFLDTSDSDDSDSLNSSGSSA